MNLDWVLLLFGFVTAGRGGRKLDDVRDKYQKACRKLHLTHNEYVLLLCEAAEYERDFRTVLLPGLLDHQQAVQEAFVLSWWVYTVIICVWFSCSTFVSDTSKINVYMCILCNQRFATYRMFFIIISALHVSGGFSAHHQELIKLCAALGSVMLSCCLTLV